MADKKDTKDKKAAKKEEDREAKINEIFAESGGQNVKMEIDYSDKVEKAIPEARDLAAKNQLNEALELLQGLEKQTRTGADMHSTSKILVEIVNLCFQAKQWDLLNDQIVLLTKKRSQLKAAVTKMVKECYGWIKEGQVQPKEVELRLIDTLRTVTQGKIYVEVERARLTHRLAQLQEQDGDINAAAKTMQDLQVETYGSMDKKEKVELILEQMRLCLATKDYIRTQIISKKISIRFLENTDYQDLKLTFYKYMIEMDMHEGSYLNICRHYRAIYDTPKIQENDKEKLDALRHMAIYVILSPYDNEQSDLIHRTMGEKALAKIPTFKVMLELFTNLELIHQAEFSQNYEADLKKDLPTVFNDSTEGGRQRWADLKNRVVEHNIRIMANYYTKITLKRMTQLLALSEREAEDFLSSMVVNKTVEAKIDRLTNIVDFTKHQDPNDMLNTWSHSVSEILALVQKTTHLVNKEEMVHKHLLGK